MLTILRTRLELVAVELQEESLRLFSYVFLSLIALICASITVLLGVLLVIVLWWDTHRIIAIVGLMAFFSCLTLIIGFLVRNSYRKKPKLLAYTRGEIQKDIDSLNSPT